MHQIPGLVWFEPKAIGRHGSAIETGKDAAIDIGIRAAAFEVWREVKVVRLDGISFGVAKSRCRRPVAVSVRAVAFEASKLLVEKLAAAEAFGGIGRCRRNANRIARLLVLEAVRESLDVGDQIGALPRRERKPGGHESTVNAAGNRVEEVGVERNAPAESRTAFEKALSKVTGLCLEKGSVFAFAVAFRTVTPDAIAAEKLFAVLCVAVKCADFAQLRGRRTGQRESGDEDSCRGHAAPSSTKANRAIAELAKNQRARQVHGETPGTFSRGSDYQLEPQRPSARTSCRIDEMKDSNR